MFFKHKLAKRQCDILFEISRPFDGWEGFDITINGEKHYFNPCWTMGDMLGAFIEVLYKLYIEIPDENCSTNDSRIKYICNDELYPSHITDLKASIWWDNEGENFEWIISRHIDNGFAVEIEINTFTHDGNKKYNYKVSYFDLCYAVAKATTKLLVNTGFVGYKYLSEADSININYLLHIKYAGIFKEHIPRLNYDSFDNKEFLKDEIKLLLFAM